MRFLSSSIVRFVLFLVAATTVAETAKAQPATKPVPISVDLTLSTNALDMPHLKASRMGFRPAGAKLIKEKPAGVIKEPAYIGSPMYGAFRVGNGLKSITLFVVDEPAEGEGKIYVDVNQNGDLTDDGPGKWEIFQAPNYRTNVTVHASWGSPLREEAGGDYALFIYKQHGSASVGYTKLTAREGTVKLGEKTYKILLHENMSDGIFTVPAKDDRTRNPVELCIDINGDGTFKGFAKTIDDKNYNLPERYNLTDAFEIDGQWYTARPSIGGASLHFFKADAPGAAVEAAVPKGSQVILPIGSAAPEFSAEGLDGKPVKLSDFKGKVVLIDFWATWCGPCQIAMPGLQRIYDKVKDQGVVVVSLCVYDDREKYDAWIAKHNGTDYNFTFAFDPAARDSEKSIAARVYGASVLPTMFVIDRDGKVRAMITSAGQEEVLKKVLGEVGVNVPTTQPAEK